MLKIAMFAPAAMNGSKVLIGRELAWCMPWAAEYVQLNLLYVKCASDGFREEGLARLFHSTSSLSESRLFNFL